MGEIRQTLQEIQGIGDNSGQDIEAPSLYRWLLVVSDAVYLSTGELAATVQPWRTIPECVNALWQLGMAHMVMLGCTKAPDDVQVTKSIETTFLRLAPTELEAPLMAIVMATDEWVGELVGALMQLDSVLGTKAVQAAKGKRTIREPGQAGQEKGKGKVTWNTIWAELLWAEVPQEEINGLPTPELYKSWLQLSAGQCSAPLIRNGKGGLQETLRCHPFLQCPVPQLNGPYRQHGIDL
ncbi:hypothetical protein llap_16674 [Limosa lapponica baueri]|uniref:Uncharacterized protein n=1 Tax=Limosa lapponica baueri TaxID=1758121 RepID=A0A2I0TGU9_LIMLA|nr:hypothetical protein llap_16674 [Limosa lapponica baueri]